MTIRIHATKKITVSTKKMCHPKSSTTKMIIKMRKNWVEKTAVSFDKCRNQRQETNLKLTKNIHKNITFAGILRYPRARKLSRLAAKFRAVKIMLLARNAHAQVR